MAAAGHLGGRGVLVTRPAGQAAGLCRLIEDAGGRAIPFPTIVIAPPSAPEKAEHALAEAWDLMLFVSRNAVEGAIPLLPGRRLPEGTRLAVIGQATARALEAAGRSPDLVPAGRYDSESLLALRELADLRGRRVLIVRGEGGLGLLGETLSGRGAEVAYAQVYRRALPQVDPAPLLARWRRDIQVVTVTSGEILDNLIRLLGEGGRARLLATPLVVVSERTRRAALDAGFQRVELAERADDQSVLTALCRTVQSGGPS
jgi:uroporphyrinogen-III synthase